MQITIHRGTHQIGGCVTEIRSGGTRIIIDMGSELPTIEKKDETEFNIDGVTTGQKDCSGVFISHYHGDHVGMFERVIPDIPVYMGEDARSIFYNVRKWLRDENLKRIEDFKTFIPGRKIRVSGEMSVTPYRVDHSAYDAYMFLIEAEGKRVLHTGDFRSHGWTGKGLQKVAEKLIKNVNVLITEGTTLTRDDTDADDYGEMNLLMDAKAVMQKYRNVFILCSSVNIDSIASFYQAAQNCKRLFVCDRYQRTNLDIVSRTAMTDLYRFPRAKIYKPGKGDVANSDCLRKMKAMGFCMLIRANGYFNEVLEKFPDSVLIYSMWNGYLKAKHPAHNPKMIELKKTAGSLGIQFMPLHTSGHATKETIVKLCKTLTPDFLMPIHVEDPKRFKELDLGGCIVKDDLKDGDPFNV